MYIVEQNMAENKINVIVRVEVLELFIKLIQSYYRYNVIYIGEQHIESPEDFKINLPKDITHLQFTFNKIPVELNKKLLWGISFIPEYQYFTTESYPKLDYQYLTEKEFMDSLSKYPKPTNQEYYNTLKENYTTHLNKLINRLKTITVSKI